MEITVVFFILSLIVWMSWIRNFVRWVRKRRAVRILIAQQQYMDTLDQIDTTHFGRLTKAKIEEEDKNKKR